MTRDEALKILRNNLWVAVIDRSTGQRMILDVGQAILIENDPTFPMRDVQILINLQGQEAWEVGKALSPKRIGLARADGTVIPVLVEDDEEEAEKPQIILQ